MGQTCDDYDAAACLVTLNDDDDFTAGTMCVVCGGGATNTITADCSYSTVATVSTPTFTSIALNTE
jgi:hypothetical protein